MSKFFPRTLICPFYQMLSNVRATQCFVIVRHPDNLSGMFVLLCVELNVFLCLS